MPTLTPYMQLVLPTIGVDTGIVWEESVNTNTAFLDAHNHSNGSGLQITPLGLNINQDLPFNGNNATSLRASLYTSQASLFSSGTDIGCTYVFGNELYYRDISGNNVQITSAGTINATGSSISLGTASAAFDGPPYVLKVNAASNTPADIQGANILVGNTGISASNYVKLAPVSALSASYTLILPRVSPSGTQLLAIDTSGNITPTTTVSSTIADNIGVQMTSVAANNILSNFTSIAHSQADIIANAVDTGGANAIAAAMNATGANSIANVMSNASANTIAGKVNSTASANNITATSNNTLILNPGGTTGRFLFGFVRNSSGSGSGYSWTSTTSGTLKFYTVTFTTPFTLADSSVVATPAGPPPSAGTSPYISGFNNASFNFNFPNLGNFPGVDVPFSFFVAG